MVHNYTDNVRDVNLSNLQKVTVGTGTGLSLPSATNYSVILNIVGTGTGTVKLQGSSDGTNWYDIVSFTQQSTSSVTVGTFISHQAHNQVRSTLSVAGTSGTAAKDSSATVNIIAN